MTDTTITVRVSKELRERLEAIGRVTRRSKSFLSNAAIEDFVRREEEFLDDLRQAELDIDEGRGISQEEVVRMSEEIIAVEVLKKAS